MLTKLLFDISHCHHVAKMTSSEQRSAHSNAPQQQQHQQQQRRRRGFRMLIIGPPGCGKGFLSSKIVNEYKCLHISTGNILRKHVVHRTDLGKKVQKYLEQGQLVPDVLLMAIVNRAITNTNNENFLLDGYPRNLTQARNLAQHTKIDFVLNIEIPWRMIVKRVQTRYVHISSGRTYNLYGEGAPKRWLRDDETDEKLVRRPDDEPNVLLLRLKQYDKQMQPVMAFYNKNFLLVTFQLRKHEDLWPKVQRYLKSKWQKVDRNQ